MLPKTLPALRRTTNAPSSVYVQLTIEPNVEANAAELQDEAVVARLLAVDGLHIHASGICSDAEGCRERDACASP